MEKGLAVAHERLKWWIEARFGMFLHWGLFSIHSRGVWSTFLEHTPYDEHSRLADRFTPESFDAGKWVLTAQEAGMRYMVLTTRNHDGFCLFDSATTGFTAPKTACGRDIVGEFVEACREAGMPIGFYYSLLDWRVPGTTRDSLRGPDHIYSEMVDQAHAQVRELMANYGKVDILWYDGMTPWDPSLWRSEELNRMVRELQPEIVINDRAGLAEDFGTPEQQITPESRPWEACYTMNDHWGWVEADRHWKTPRDLLQLLCTSVSSGGNLLLNVSPMPDGRFPRESMERLSTIGRWMRTNGEAIYGAGYCPWYARGIGWNTQKKNTDGTWSVYVLCGTWLGTDIVIGWCGNRVLKAQLLATGEPVDVKQEGDRVFLSGLPLLAPDETISVIHLTVDSEPRRSQPDNAGVEEIAPRQFAP